MKKMSPKILVTSVAIALITCSAITIGNRMITVGSYPTIQEAVRLLLTVGLALFLIRGWRPSRMIAMVLLSISVIIAIVWTVYFLANSYFPGFMILISLVHAACLYALRTETAKLHFCASTRAEQGGNLSAPRRIP